MWEDYLYITCNHHDQQSNTKRKRLAGNKTQRIANLPFLTLVKEFLPPFKHGNEESEETFKMSYCSPLTTTHKHSSTATTAILGSV